MRGFLIILAAYALYTEPSGFSWGSPFQETWWYVALRVMAYGTAACVLYRRIRGTENPAPGARPCLVRVHSMREQGIIVRNLESP